jgi:TM2 domain-containing membrane protein YozV
MSEIRFGRATNGLGKSSIKVSDKGLVPVSLLCFFFGFLGFHRFYVGKHLTGVLMLVTLGGLGIWQIIDFVRISIGVFNDKDDLPLKQNPPSTSEVSEKSKTPAILLCFFLGFLGFHRFYVGKILTGILMLVTLGGLGIWQLIDLITIILGAFKDKEGLTLKNQ